MLQVLLDLMHFFSKSNFLQISATEDLTGLLYIIGPYKHRNGE